MSVATPKQEYSDMLPKWERMRDAVAGEDAIKARGSQYLPVPPGVDQAKGEADPAYVNYLKRATYPDVVGPAIQGMVGLMSRKQDKIDIPGALDYLYERATPDGLVLEEVLGRTRHEILTTGRYILFVDAPEDGGDPWIATYAAESLINWRTDGERITLLVFEESVREPNPNDPYVELDIKQWREAAVEQNEAGERYVVRVWRKTVDRNGEESFEVVSETAPTKRGETWDQVPAVVVGSRDLLPDPDALPLLGVANKSLDYYRQVADYRLGLFMSSQATPYATGMNPEDKPTVIGPSGFIAVEAPDARVGFLEISGAGLDAQRQALEDTKSEMMDQAMRVLGDGRRAAESAEALRLRFQSQTATLSSVATSTAMGLKRALQFIAEWIGADVEAITVEPAHDFIKNEADAQVLTSIFDGFERGLLPQEVLADYARRTGLTDKDTDEFLAMLPQAQALPSGDDEA